MLAGLIAALSLASAVTLDVPFVPQTDLLCGGAAVSMVFRFWGDAHADAQQFASLVDRRAGGIADDVLVEAVRRRGWRTVRVSGQPNVVTSELQQHHPLIVLIGQGGSRYHYVVVTGVDDAGVTVHDPSWGPSRPISHADFDRLWKASGYWSLLILPDTTSAADNQRLADRSNGARPSDTESPCDALLSAAVGQIRRSGLAAADVILASVRSSCPQSAGPVRELAGIRFAERRWDDAAALARQALAIDDRDTYAWDVLGSSLFMRDDPAGALTAWNHIGKPRLNVVSVRGNQRSRYQTITDVLSLRPNSLLTAAAFERARHRLEELPDRLSARLALRPAADGFATVDVVIVERSTQPHGRSEWLAAAARTAIDREVAVAAPGRTGQGELWSASWRW